MSLCDSSDRPVAPPRIVHIHLRFAAAWRRRRPLLTFCSTKARRGVVSRDQTRPNGRDSFRLARRIKGGGGGMIAMAWRWLAISIQSRNSDTWGVGNCDTFARAVSKIADCQLMSAQQCRSYQSFLHTGGRRHRWNPNMRHGSGRQSRSNRKCRHMGSQRPWHCLKEIG